jgi:hypothetical protein
MSQNANNEATKNAMTTSWDDKNLVISTEGLSSEFDKDKPWKVANLDPSRIFAYSDGKAMNPEGSQGFAQCTPDMLYDLLKGMNHRRWSGQIFIEYGFGVKRLFLKNGQLVFASSEWMDDRLGEVFYRHDKISLDQLTRFSVQVDRKTKFGKVLLNSGDFTNVDLWNALKSQVMEIFRGIFVVEKCYIEVQSGKAPIEITFEVGLQAILEESYTFGIQFRKFRQRISPAVKLHLTRDADLPSIAAGTFYADLMSLCEDEPSVKEFLGRSKLAETNTLLAVHKLMASGRITLSELSEAEPLQLDGGVGQLKSVLDGYQLLHGIAMAAFHAAGIKAPIRDLQAFCLALNSECGDSLYLDRAGLIAASSELGIMQQCARHFERRSFFEIRVESLTRYLLQISGDTLPYDIAKKLAKDFKEIIS